MTKRNGLNEEASSNVNRLAQPTSIKIGKKRKRKMSDKDQLNGVDQKKSSSDSQPVKKPSLKKPKKTTTEKTAQNPKPKKTTTEKTAQNPKPITTVTSSSMKHKRRKKPKSGSKMVTPTPVERIELPSTADTMSSNWKELQQALLATSDKPKKRSKSKRKVPTKTPTVAQIESSSTPVIWFDDVDDLLIESLKVSLSSKSASSDTLIKNSMFTGVTKVVAIDCEMVGVGDGQESILARVSIVNHDGHPLYDKFVKPREAVTDYRTFVSGVRPEDLVHAQEFDIVQKEVAELIKDRILVGHALHHDLKVLFLSHPWKKTRDTAKFKPFRRLSGGKTPGLKKLAKELLGVEVQTGEHSSVQDAQAAMRIYTMHRKEWEKYMKSGRRTMSTKKRLRPSSAPTTS